MEMLFGVSKITGIDDWKFTYYKDKKKREATKENLKDIVPSSSKIYEQKMQKFRTDEVKSFFSKTLMDDLVLENNKIKAFVYKTDEGYVLETNRKYVFETFDKMLEYIDSIPMKQY